LHRARHGCRLPHEPLQHRRGGPALRGRDHGRDCRASARRFSVSADLRGDDRRRRFGRRASRGGPGNSARVLLDERDHHFADAQLRRRSGAGVPDLRQSLVPACHVRLRGERLPAGQDTPRRGDLVALDDSRSRPAAGLRARNRSCRSRLGALFAYAVWLRSSGDRRLATRRPVCGNAHAAEDCRGHVPFGCDRRSRWREPDRRLPPPARPARPTRCELWVHGHRRRCARPLQPVCGRARGVAARWPSERRLHFAGRRLPGRSRRCHAGADPVLRARWRALRALPREVRVVNNSLVVVVIASGILFGTPLLFAALGELLAERSGVLNLGVEGMMLMGAVTGFWAVERIHAARPLVLAAAVGVAALAGAALALIHAFLVITLRANQIVSGLALTIFAGAAGLSSYLGNDLHLSGKPARYQFQEIFPKSLQDLPIVGPVIFGQPLLVYASWACVVLIALYLTRTRPGLNVRAVGESPAAADAMGVSVPRYRYAHTLVGGAFAGI